MDYCLFDCLFVCFHHVQYLSTRLWRPSFEILLRFYMTVWWSSQWLGKPLMNTELIDMFRKHSLLCDMTPIHHLHQHLDYWEWTQGKLGHAVGAICVHQEKSRFIISSFFQSSIELVPIANFHGIHHDPDKKKICLNEWTNEQMGEKTTQHWMFIFKVVSLKFSSH